MPYSENKDPSPPSWHAPLFACALPHESSHHIGGGGDEGGGGEGGGGEGGGGDGGGDGGGGEGGGDGGNPLPTPPTSLPPSAQHRTACWVESAKHLLSSALSPTAAVWCW